MFVLYEFADPLYEVLYKKECRIMGYSALLDIAFKKYPMPELDRPLFSISMENVVSCFTGFRNREEVVSTGVWLMVTNRFSNFFKPTEWTCFLHSPYGWQYP